MIGCNSASIGELRCARAHKLSNILEGHDLFCQQEFGSSTAEGILVSKGSKRAMSKQVAYTYAGDFLTRKIAELGVHAYTPLVWDE